MTTEATDGDLVARCLESQEAFAALYQRHAAVVLGFLTCMHHGDEHGANDSLQETFLRAFNALPRFDGTRPMRPWLLKIALNVSLDALERGKRIEARDPATLPPRTSRNDPAGAAASNDACRSVLGLAARTLPARKLAAFVLARAQGLTYEEIATIQGCSTVTVKRDLQEALRALAGAAAQLGLA